MISTFSRRETNHTGVGMGETGRRYQIVIIGWKSIIYKVKIKILYIKISSFPWYIPTLLGCRITASTHQPIECNTLNRWVLFSEWVHPK